MSKELLNAIKLDNANTQTIQAIIDNVKISGDLKEMIVAILSYQHTQDVSGKFDYNNENMQVNFGIRTKASHDDISFIYHFMNTIIEENKKLKDIVDNNGPKIIIK